MLHVSLMVDYRDSLIPPTTSLEEEHHLHLDWLEHIPQFVRRKVPCTFQIYSDSGLWINTLDRHPGSAPWIKTLDQPIGLIHWINTLDQQLCNDDALLLQNMFSITWERGKCICLVPKTNNKTCFRFFLFTTRGTARNLGSHTSTFEEFDSSRSEIYIQYSI